MPALRVQIPLLQIPQVLFLDVDGVLHPANVRFPDRLRQCRDGCLEVLQRLVAETLGVK